jgi:hypothetical protein
MFKNFFKSKLQRLQDKHQLLLRKSFEVSKTDRKLSDKYMTEALKLEDQIISMQKKS